MDFIIGRDANTSQLRISTADGKRTQLVGQPGCVPMNVSRKHLQLTVNADRTCVARNLNPANETWVNGMAVMTRNISWGDRVEMGAGRFPLDWTAIEPLLPKTIDITPLKRVWSQYKQREMAIRKRQQNNNVLAGVPMVFTIGGGVVTNFLSDDLKSYGVIITIIALVLMCYGLYRRFTDKSIEEQEELKQWLQQHYTCPECGHFMGIQDYDVLSQNKACPYCRTQYKK